MPTRKSKNSPSTSDPLVLELKRKLHDTRRTVISIVPEKFRELLRSYQYLNGKDNAWGWGEATAGEIVALADIHTAAEMGDLPSNSPRAQCPLCDGHSSAAAHGISGFAVPDGLKRHILGTHTSKQCDVFFAALELCREHLDELGAPR